MSERTPENQFGDFTLIKNHGEAQVLMNECLRSKAKVILWAEGQNDRINGVFDVHPVNGGKAFSVVVTDPLDFDSLDEEFKKIEATHLYFSVSLAKANIFFRAPFLGRAGNMLKFEVPAKIFKVQRRKHMRFQIREGYVLRVSFQLAGLEFSKKVYDVSAGGVSFMVDEGENLLFENGAKVQRICIEVYGKRVLTDGLIRHSLGMRGGFKVGVQFTSIDEKDAEQLDRFVFEENIRFMARDM